MSGFSISSVRNNNRVILYKVVNNGEPQKVFTAYLKNGFGFSLGSNSNMLFSKSSLFDTGINLLQNPLVKHVIKATDISVAVDITRKAQFSGASPVSFSIPCFLVLKSTYTVDIADELNSLMDVYLPKRGNVINDFTNRLTKFTDQKRAEAISNAADAGNPNSTGGIWDILSGVVHELVDYLGPVYELKNPAGIAEGTELRLQVGTYMFSPVMIKNVGVTFPAFLVEGGKPDHVQIQLDVETLRGATGGLDGLIKF